MVDDIGQMASWRGLTTVAAGVERLEQQQLEAAGVDALQGYLYRRPGPAEEIAPGCGGRATDTEVPSGTDRGVTG